MAYLVIHFLLKDGTSYLYCYHHCHHYYYYIFETGSPIAQNIVLNFVCKDNIKLPISPWLYFSSTGSIGMRHCAQLLHLCMHACIMYVDVFLLYSQGTFWTSGNSPASAFLNELSHLPVFLLPSKKEHTSLSFSGCFSTHILGRYASRRTMWRENPLLSKEQPSSVLITALQSVLCKRRQTHTK